MVHKLSQTLELACPNQRHFPRKNRHMTQDKVSEDILLQKGENKWHFHNPNPHKPNPHKPSPRKPSPHKLTLDVWNGSDAENKNGGENESWIEGIRVRHHRHKDHLLIACDEIETCILHCESKYTH